MQRTQLRRRGKIVNRSSVLPLLFAVACLASEASSQRRVAVPWAAETRCALNPTHDKGLHSGALAALRGIGVAHRITQGINNPAAPGNVHYTDGTLNSLPYTGAADISVRCLTAAQIKMLLERLADAGFAAWYRKAGQDDWTGPPHIHAVWAGCALKPVLRQQVMSWLDGNNGLGSDRPYRFWQPSAAAKEKVRAMYRASNP
jgi:hypothetical protein